MPLSDFLYVDDQDDVMAAHMNRNTESALRGELGAAVSITTQTALTDGDFPFLKLTPNANLDVLLPPEATTNHIHVIQNGSGTYTLTVKEDSDTTTIAAIGPLSVAIFIPSVGTGWAAIKSISNPAASERVHTLIDGLELIWNSSTSISVGVGACYAENGDWIDATSAITKASLSLSNNTWYHVYVYLSAGVASAEVVTTAPVAWKGTAYSKTGDTSRRYVGSIKSGSSANVWVFNQIRNQVIWAEDEVGILRVLTGGAATTETDISLATHIPATSMIALCSFVNASGSGQVLYTGASGNDNVAPPTTGIITCAAGVIKSTWHPTDAAQNISYAMSAVSGGVNVNCNGYLFQR